MHHRAEGGVPALFQVGGTQTQLSCSIDEPAFPSRPASADGRTHAHRIYLAEGGQGKAQLGTGPDGRSRSPKKSAQILDKDKIAGRSVLWGDPSRAPHVILAEGIETAAAVALALWTEICGGKPFTTAAIRESVAQCRARRCCVYENAPGPGYYLLLVDDDGGFILAERRKAKQRAGR
jgi:hypothetical protein